VGGGIRDYETLSQWLDLGVTRCVIGTAALDLKWMEGAVERFGADRLVVGLDGRDGKMAVHGWTEQTEVSLVSMAQQLFDVGVRYALVTDVARDGTLSGANIEIAKAIQATGMQAIASGGVRSVDDVLAAKQAGLAGVIAGRSLYDGTLDLSEAIRVAKGVKTC
jgi:phosphoribosylformimino-5-aminoimidazole carboxamide ribotide isomerase